MALYPPIMASSQDAFLATITPEPIYFTLSNLTNIAEIECIQIKVVYQSNNKSAVDTSKYPDGIIYKSSSSITSLGNSQYYIGIDKADLAEGWRAGSYYKVQIAFGKNKLWTETNQEFSAWKATQVKLGAFSEWSTVMVLKAISTPDIKIANQGNVIGGGDLIIESTNDVELTTTPLFQGVFSCETEAEDKYRFEIYKENENEPFKSSGWLQHNNIGSVDTYRFPQTLIDENSYYVTYEVKTVNGYYAKAKDYNFTINQNFLTVLEGVILTVEDSTNEEEPYADENGCLVIKLTTTQPFSGNYVLTRTSEKSGYAVFEDIKYLVYSNHVFKNEVIYTDFTVESGIKYKYAFQQENQAGLRTSPIYEGESLAASPERQVNFQYSYLYCDDVQLKLRFNHTMNSFKHTVLEAKQDTLGSRYPTVSRNGDAYYAEFPINALISFHMDDAYTFFEKKRDGYYYKGEKVISWDKYKPDEEEEMELFNQDLTNNNIFIERIFREKIEEFLNDGGYKLYKSPTEGNIIVTLMNVSFSPETKLGRMIFSVSATAYEILDNTIENLDKYGIISIGQFTQDITNNEKEMLIGQISGLFDTSTNLVDIIKAQNEYDIGGGYQYSFLNLHTIQVEPYPNIDFSVQLKELQANYIQAKTAGDEDLMEQLKTEIEEMSKLAAAVNSQVLNPIIRLLINGQEIVLGSNKIYQLQDASAISDIRLKYKEPVIINYSCYVKTEESKSKIVSGVTSSSVWGQVAGVFTNNKDILDNYQFTRGEDLEIKSEYKFNAYQSLDIFAIIKEQVRHQVEAMYNTEFYYDKKEQKWTDGSLYYTFEKFTSLEIESDEGTSFIITNNDNTKQQIFIGNTNKFRWRNLDNQMNNISLDKPAFLIVNYRCKTMQTRMGGA